MLTQLTHRVPVVFKFLANRKADRKIKATDFLIQDHLKIEGMILQFKLLKRLSERFPSRKKELLKRQEEVFDRIFQTLERHTAAEEALLYGECEKHEETRALALESYEEHREIKTLLKDLSRLSVDSETFEAKFTLLVEDVAHHVREEEGKLFPRLRKVWSAAHLKKLGGQLRNYKKTARRGGKGAQAA